MAENRVCLCIDLKSFYASVECVARGLDPLRTNLVVADASRTEKTICLAVSPSLKAYGIPGRPRLFEVIEKVGQINAARRQRAPGRQFAGESCDDDALRASPELSLGYITATPRMSYYLECSARIYELYLRHLAPEDIHVYSIDEVFLELTGYLPASGKTAWEYAQMLVGEIYAETGITATAGIGTNLYLGKVAMDIVAKHAEPDERGARIAALDELRYRELLWDHRPLTDFWRVGHGYAKKLEAHRLYTMGDIARCSLGGPDDYYNEDLLYRLFGVNAELLIDHAWGWEPCTMAQIKAYRPSSNSISSGQVLSCPYPYDKARLIVREMTELVALDLVGKGVVTDQVGLCLGYDAENLADPARGARFTGEVTTDWYGRRVPKSAHGSANLDAPTSSTKKLLEAVLGIFARVADERLLVRRVTITAAHLVPAPAAEQAPAWEQLDLFTGEAERQKKAEEQRALERERRMQQAVLSIQKKYGKNAILKGMNLEEGATTVARNGQIGGHRK
jgi:DNA polymerase V